MSQHYSDQTRANDPHALPNVATFQARYGDCNVCGQTTTLADFSAYGECPDLACKGRCLPAGVLGVGWYWQTCLPGCLPDSDAYGPFATETEALDDARNSIADDAENYLDN